MEMQSLAGSIILIFTGLVTYNGFLKKEYFEKYTFEVDRILIDKERHRLITSGFLHLDWIHFGFNMIALLSFSSLLEMYFGYLNFTLIYFGSLLGGSLLALYIHRYHGDYRAAGASGAVSGVVFASIILFPHSEIGFILLPFSVPSWILGFLFVVISIIGIKMKLGNIGHEAHLGGAITGVLISIIMEPSLALENWWIVLLVLVPTAVFLIIIIRFPSFLIIDKGWKASLKTIQLKRNKSASPNRAKKVNSHLALDDILDKIKREGMESLSKREKTALEEWRDKI